MPKPVFRVNRYAHPKYKFLARAKVNGKWCRHYFRTEAEAIAFARQQNSESQSSPVRGPETVDYGHNNFARLNEPTYTGPFIERYFGDHWSMIKHHPAPTALIPRFNSPLIALVMRLRS